MEQHGISKLDLKRRNRMQVLKILKQRGPTSRIDIATTLELTRAAVTIITNEMIEQGIIMEIGEYKHISEKAPRGRKKILIDINYHYKFALGVTIEENAVSVGLTTLSGEVLDKRNRYMNINLDDKQALIDFIDKSIREILNDNCLDKGQILGIGFGIYPSIYDMFQIKMIDGVPDYSKAKEFVASFTDLPVVFGNSVKGTAMANIDFLKKKNPNFDSIIFLQYGREINFIATHKKNPIIAYHNQTNFVDKIIVDPNSSDICPICGRRGCVENEITSTAILKRIERVFSKDKTPYLYQLTGGDKKKIEGDMIISSYQNGDKEIVNILDRAVALMAMLINNLYFITNPHKIVLHLFYLDSDFEFELLKNAVKKIAGEEVSEKLEFSMVENKHRFLSGCALAVRELFFEKGGFVDN
ncbi:MAG: ROK family protein [Ruminococcus sp.]|nr:ROK family protein [Ruminococcus sp.]